MPRKKISPQGNGRKKKTTRKSKCSKRQLIQAAPATERGAFHFVFVHSGVCLRWVSWMLPGEHGGTGQHINKVLLPPQECFSRRVSSRSAASGDFGQCLSRRSESASNCQGRVYAQFRLPGASLGRQHCLLQGSRKGRRGARARIPGLFTRQ